MSKPHASISRRSVALFGDLAPDSYAAIALCDVRARRANWRIVRPERRRASRSRVAGVIDSWYQNRYQLIAVGPQPVEPPDRTGVVDAPRRLLEQDLLATSREVDEHRGA